jgi:hypothetical protein
MVVTIWSDLIGDEMENYFEEEIANARVRVILIPSHPFSATWRHAACKSCIVRPYVLSHVMFLYSLPGPPLTQEIADSILLAHNVVGIEEQWITVEKGNDIADANQHGLQTTLVLM